MLRRAAALLAALVIVMTSSAVVRAPASASDPVFPSCADGQPCVLVTWTGSVPDGHHIFDQQEIDGLIPQGDGTTYPFCGFNCPPVQPKFVPKGVPVPDLIDALNGVGFGPDEISSATISDGRNPDATLSGDTDDFASIGDPDVVYPFNGYKGGPPLYPLVFPNGGGYGYFRSQRIDQVNEQNGSNDLQTLQNGQLRIDLTVPGRILKPVIHLSDSSINEHQSVKFGARVPGGTPSNAKYTWFIGKLNVSRKVRFVQKFDKSGSYKVYVKVKGDNASGKSDVETITVGKRATEGAPGPGRGTGDRNAPVNGPNHGTGVNAGARPDAPSSGPYGAPTGANTNAAGREQGGSGSPSATPSKTRPVGSQNERGFVSINGVLLNPTAATVVPSAQRRAGQPETAPAARAGAPTSKSIAFGLLLGAAALVLLVLGALGESRRPGRGLRRRSHA